MVSVFLILRRYCSVILEAKHVKLTNYLRFQFILKFSFLISFSTFFSYKLIIPHQYLSLCMTNLVQFGISLFGVIVKFTPRNFFFFSFLSIN